MPSARSGTCAHAPTRSHDAMAKSRINHFGVFSGSGIGAAGMQDAKPAIPGLEGEMVCLGGIDAPAKEADPS